jgi:hypothetical protein
MAVNKNFVVKNGLEVNTDLILANANTNRVGIGSTIPSTTLDVIGGIAATDVNVSGVATIVRIVGTSATITYITGTNLTGTNLNITGVGTITNLNVTGGGDIEADSIRTTNLNVTGVGTINNLDISGGDIEADSIRTTNLNTTGISTLANVTVGSAVTIANYGIHATGVITATSFSGDATNLKNTSIALSKDGNFVGAAVTLLDIRSTGITTITTGSGIGTVDFVAGGGGGGGGGGIGTALDSNAVGMLESVVFSTFKTFTVTGTGVTAYIEAPAGAGGVTYSIFGELIVGVGNTVQIAVGTTLKTDILGIFTT